jgi:hypothetical protein
MLYATHISHRPISYIIAWTRIFFNSRKIFICSKSVSSKLERHNFPYYQIGVFFEQKSILLDSRSDAWNRSHTQETRAKILSTCWLNCESGKTQLIVSFCFPLLLTNNELWALYWNEIQLLKYSTICCICYNNYRAI